jgi:hypothetical protein
MKSFNLHDRIQLRFKIVELFLNLSQLRLLLKFVGIFPNLIKYYKNGLISTWIHIFKFW